MSHFVPINGASACAEIGSSVLIVIACVQIHHLGQELHQQTNECTSLAGKSEALEQEYRVNAAATEADESKIKEKIIAARKSKSKLTSLRAIYEAYKAVESARKEVNKIKDDIKSREEAVASIKESLLRLRKQRQAVKKQACAWAITQTWIYKCNAVLQISDAFFSVR